VCSSDLLSVTQLGKRAFARWGARSIALGLAIQLAGIGLMSAVCAGLLGEPQRWVLAWPGLLAQGLLGLGVGFIGPPLTSVSLQAVPRSQAGGASGVVNAGRQFAAVAAVALVAALVQRHGGSHTPATLLLALPALALMAVAGAVLAWRLPSLPVPAAAPGGAH
jgi:MFS family permease